MEAQTFWFLAPHFVSLTSLILLPFRFPPAIPSNMLLFFPFGPCVDHPLCLIGPDLARVGGRYSDDWQRLHLMDPRALVPESNMPGYPWLAERMVDGELITAKLEALQFLGDPYTDDQIAGAAAAVEGKTELDAIVAYLQELGTNRRNRR